jgi:3-isopropylmalate dehydrogenase
VKASIAVLPGDGIGPEVTAAAVDVLERIAQRGGHDFAFDRHPIGGEALERTGHPLPPETLRAARQADAVFLGAVGGPRWDSAPAAVRPERGLLGLRQGLGVFANLRPIRPHPALVDRSPVRAERLAGVDLVFVRELTGGLYFAEPKRRSVDDGVRSAVDTLAYDEREIRRVVELAFALAAGRRGRVTSIDKANVLASSQLWREVTDEVAQGFPQVALDHQLVDAAAMRLIDRPAAFDVVVTENLFGDVLTDEAAVLCGSLGLIPSASLAGLRAPGSVGSAGSAGSADAAATTPGLYEPIHGSAPDIAGRGIANPIGAILSAALLLRYSLGLEAEARAIEQAVDRALAEGLRTADLVDGDRAGAAGATGATGATATTADATRIILAALD